LGFFRSHALAPVEAVRGFFEHRAEAERLRIGRKMREAEFERVNAGSSG